MFSPLNSYVIVESYRHSLRRTIMTHRRQEVNLFQTKLITLSVLRQLSIIDEVHDGQAGQ